MSLHHIRGRIVTADIELADGVVTVEGADIVSVRDVDNWVRAYPDTAIPPGSGTILPGLVDIHNHGGGGHAFTTTDIDEARAAAAHHHARGSTSVLAGIITAPVDTMIAQLRMLSELEAVDGIYCEGPFLARARCGAQDPRYLLEPDADVLRHFADAADGALRVLTVAPELPSSPEFRRAAACCAIALGHSDADFDTFADALPPYGQARLVTHLANGMPPLHHRSAGPVAAAIAAAARGEAIVELIADGVHLDPGFVRMVFAAAPGRVALITDAMAAAGMPDGSYDLGPQQVTVHEGRARLANGSLAGSTSHLLDNVARVVRYGIPLAEAIRAATVTPAEAAGLHRVGDLRAGYRADLLIVDDDLRPKHVVRQGVQL